MMMSFKLKTVIGVGIIETVLLIILVTSSLNLLKTTKESELKNLANTTAALFATSTKDAVIAFDLGALESFVAEVMKNQTLVYARVLSSQGDVLAEGSQPGVSLRPFIQDRSIDDVDDGVFDTYSDIIESEDVYGRVELGFSTDEIGELLDYAKKRTLIIAVVELLLSATFSIGLGFYLTRQLAELKLASRRIVDGDLGFEIEVKSKDELGEVADAFNNMSKSLQSMWDDREQAQNNLIKLNEQLEQKVIDRTAQLEEAQNSALESAHRAGMADVAAGVLHNIGNLINSAKTSTTLIADGVHNSNLKKLNRANEMLVDKMKNFSEFSSDENNKTLLNYILSVSNELNSEQNELRLQLKEVQDSIENTAQTIREQQVYAKDPMRFETEVDIVELVEETISLSRSRIDALGIEVLRDYGSGIGLITTQKNKIHQIVFNFMINAVDAIEMSDTAKGVIAVSIDKTNHGVSIRVQDNGCGIGEEQLNTIFHYGITSKPSGNGAGLHSSANLTTEIKGEIEVSSDGEGKGAEFRLFIPV